jgi:hypothetical protein
MRTASVELISQAEAMHAVRPSAYDLRLYDEDGHAAPGFELVPSNGRGYPTVRVRVVLRGPRVISPVAGVQAYCATPTLCQYLPPRNGDLAGRYVVSIDENSIARLSPSKDMIAITTRELKVEEPLVVNVTLMVDGQLPVTRQIKYLRPAN